MEEEKLAKLKELERLLAQCQKILQEISGANDIKNYEKLLREIYNAGGKVTKEKLHEIGKKLGYDPRGLGGFFVGKNKSLTYIIENGEELVALTPAGYKLIS